MLNKLFLNRTPARGRGWGGLFGPAAYFDPKYLLFPQNFKDCHRSGTSSDKVRKAKSEKELKVHVAYVDPKYLLFQ